MSHNITLKGVKINDLAMLGQVVSELSGGRARLDQTARTFRTYAGQPTQCDGAILLSEGPHDIGLSKQKDGSYVPMFDPYAMSPMFKSQFAMGGMSDPSGHIGALLQEYGLCAAEYQAAQNGMASTRIPGEKGLVSLEVTSNG